MGRRLDDIAAAVARHKTFAVIMILLLFFYFIKREVCIIIVFSVLDFLKNILKVKFQFIPVDLGYIFGVTAAFFYNPIYSIIILIIDNFNRAAFGFLESRHFSSAIRDIILFFIVIFLRPMPFLAAALVMLLLKYVFHYMPEIILAHNFPVEKLHFHVVNVLISTLFFYLIDELSFLF